MMDGIGCNLHTGRRYIVPIFAHGGFFGEIICSIVYPQRGNGAVTVCQLRTVHTHTETLSDHLCLMALIANGNRYRGMLAAFQSDNLP